MKVLAFFIPLLFQLVLFSPAVRLQPAYTSQPSNPSPVVEGQNLDLQWDYNLAGQSIDLARFLNVTAGGAITPNVAIRDGNNNATVEAGYENQFRAVISDTQATLTILAVPRSFSGEKFQLVIVTARPHYLNVRSVTVEISVLLKPENVQLLTNASANQACVGSYLNFTCSVGSANPQVMSYQLLENDAVIETGGSGMWVRLLSSSGVFTFRCQANNTVGTANSASVNITVGVPPTIQPVQDETVTEGGSLNVSCHASGTPQPVVSWIKISSGQHFDGSVLKLTDVNRNQAGEYRCKASNDCETNSTTATIHVKFAPIVTIQQCPNAVTEGDNATLYCNATGYPVANIVWINASSGNVKSYNKTLVLRAITRNEKGSFECHASNEIGNSTKTCEIDVHYPPKITAPLENGTTTKKNTTIECAAKGNPPPEYFWRKADGGVVKSGSSFQVMKDGNYTCNASNHLGNDVHTIFIEIGDVEYSLEVTLENTTCPKDYNNLTSKQARTLIKQFVAEMDKLYENVTSYNRTKVFKLSCHTNGSVIVSFMVYFEAPVTKNEGLAKLRNAVTEKRLGDFIVRNLKIIQVNPTPVTSTVSAEGSTSASTTSRTKDGLPLAIIGGAIGGAVLLVVIIVVVAWCVHKKRKCRRPDSKVHNSESQVLHDRNDIEDGAHPRVNKGYAVSGPPSASGSQTPEQQQQQQAAAAPPAYAGVDKSKKQNKDKKNGNENIPDYAVVDKSKKKKKGETENSKKGEKSKGNKNADANVPEYAVVDKSIKKKKKEDERAYASVDMSKKSKKQKLKPGEVLYADLGDFQPVGQMPAVSTSPEPLPPINRPPSYQETAYADITQFLTGEATLPAGQGTEMEPTYANSGGGKGAAAKENPKTGQQDTGPKETPM